MKRQIYRLAAVLLAAVMLLSGCTIGADTAWVYSGQGVQMPAGLYIAYQIAALGDAQNIIYEQGVTQEGFVMPTKIGDILKLTVEDQNAQQWIEARTMQYVKLYYYAEQRFAELGLEMTDDLQMIADYATDSAWAQSGLLLDKNGISQESFRLRSVNDVKLQKIFELMYGEGGEREVPVEELQQKFAEDYAYVDTISATKPTAIPQGSDKVSVEEAVADMKALLESYIPRIEAGESFEDIKYEFDIAQAKLNLADESAVTRAEPGSLAMFIDKAQSPYYRADFLEQVMAAKAGEVKLIELDDVFFLIRAHDILAEEGLFDTYRMVVLESLKYEEFRAELLEQASDTAPDMNQKAVNRYKLRNLKLS